MNTYIYSTNRLLGDIDKKNVCLDLWNLIAKKKKLKILKLAW